MEYSLTVNEVSRKLAGGGGVEPPQSEPESDDVRFMIFHRASFPLIIH